MTVESYTVIAVHLGGLMLGLLIRKFITPIRLGIIAIIYIILPPALAAARGDNGNGRALDWFALLLIVIFIVLLAADCAGKIRWRSAGRDSTRTAPRAGG